MSADTLATFEGLLGDRAAKTNGIYWRKVRIGFYRPLLQLKEHTIGTVTLPLGGHLGAAQYAVPPGSAANSFLNCLFFENAQAYNIASLEQSFRRQVRLAAKQFTIRPVIDLDEFKSQGYRAYFSFQQRTGYDYGAARRDPAVFAAWADRLFRIPEVLVLGGYLNGELVGVSLSHLIDDTVYYKTFFCTTESMKHYLSGFMIHAVRTAAARNGNIKRIFAGMYKGDDGLDGFYMMRGARRVRLPAFLQINPLVRPFLQRGAPKMYARMVGDEVFAPSDSTPPTKV